MKIISLVPVFQMGVQSSELIVIMVVLEKAAVQSNLFMNK